MTTSAPESRAGKTVVFAYALYDPVEPDHLRYIGITDQKPSSRCRSHIRGALKRPRTKKGLWICEVVAAGRKPEFVVLGASRYPDAYEFERQLIAQYRRWGHALLNSTEGGDGWKIRA